MAKRKESKQARQKAALEHVKHLLAQAAIAGTAEYANAYAKEAMSTATRVNLRLPSELKRQICRKCYHFLVPGVNLRVRNTNHRMVFTCLDCKNVSSFGYLKEQKAKRASKVKSLLKPKP